MSESGEEYEAAYWPSTKKRASRKHEVRRKRARKRVAWLVVSIFGFPVLVRDTRKQALGAVLFTSERVVRVEYDWPILAPQAKRGRAR